MATNGQSVSCNVTESDRMLRAAKEQKSNKTFVVCRATSLDDLHWVMKQATEEGWMPNGGKLKLTTKATSCSLAPICSSVGVHSKRRIIKGSLLAS